MMVKIYTDGSSRGNPGPGGFGVVMVFGENRKELSRGYKLTTNNRMELLAVVSALEILKTNKFKIHITSDSKYVIDSITKGWLNGWVKKKFKGKKNKDLWLRYLKVSESYDISYTWVKGHAGHIENERCDYLAVQAADFGPWEIDQGYEKDNSLEIFD